MKSEAPMKSKSKTYLGGLLRRAIWFATGWAVLLVGIFVIGSVDDKLTWGTWSYERVGFLISMMSVTAYWTVWFMLPLIRHILGKEK